MKDIIAYYNIMMMNKCQEIILIDNSQNLNCNKPLNHLNYPPTKYCFFDLHNTENHNL